MVLAGGLCGFSLLVHRFFPFFSLYVLWIFLIQEGSANGGGDRGISSLYVLKAVMGKIGLSQKRRQ